MNFSKCLAFCFLFAFSFAAISVDVKADNSKLREKAKAELSEGIAEEDEDKTVKALIALIQMSDSGDDEASYILGILFTKSKVPKIKRSVKTAEKYLLRGAKNCHRGSLKAIGDYVYKKRGSKLFDPIKASDWNGL